MKEDTTTNQSQVVIGMVKCDDHVEVNPAIFNGIFGQNEACRKLSFFTDSHSAETPFPTLLFTGSQGLGKSYMASKVATALGRDLVEVNCANIITAKDFVETILFEKIMGNKCKTLLLDEAHQLSDDVTTLLLSFLNPSKEHKNRIAYKNLTLEYDFSKVNVIFATTDAHKMFKPLKNRCVEIYFHLYSNDELFSILQSYSGIGFLCDKQDISYACRGRARDAFILSQHIQRYCKMNKINTLTNEGWKELKDIFNIYLCGLNSQEIELMKVLNEGIPVSCHNIAVRLGVNESNVEEELEVRPKELGFVSSNSRGRILTESGIQYLKSIGV